MPPELPDGVTRESEEEEGDTPLDLSEISLGAEMPSILPGSSHKTTVRLTPTNAARARRLQAHLGVGSISDVVNIAIARAFESLPRSS